MSLNECNVSENRFKDYVVSAIPAGPLAFHLGLGGHADAPAAYALHRRLGDRRHDSLFISRPPHSAPVAGADIFRLLAAPGVRSGAFHQLARTEDRTAARSTAGNGGGDIGRRRDGGRNAGGRWLA